LLVNRENIVAHTHTPNIQKQMSNKNLKNDSSASLNEDDEKADGYEVKESKVFGEAMLLPVKDHLQKLEVCYGVMGLWLNMRVLDSLTILRINHKKPEI